MAVVTTHSLKMRIRRDGFLEGLGFPLHGLPLNSMAGLAFVLDRPISNRPGRSRVALIAGHHGVDGIEPECGMHIVGKAKRRAFPILFGMTGRATVAHLAGVRILVAGLALGIKAGEFGGCQFCIFGGWNVAFGTIDAGVFSLQGKLRGGRMKYRRISQPPGLLRMAVLARRLELAVMRILVAGLALHIQTDEFRGGKLLLFRGGMALDASGFSMFSPQWEF